MGACKLHHAVAGTKSGKKGKLKNRKVDLFVGIDMSCGGQRHFEKGERHALFFKDNVEKLIVFYQVKAGENQTGSQGIFRGKKFDKKIHINVNKHDINLKTGTRNTKGHKGMCQNVGHMDIDDCKKLRETLKKLVINQAN